MFGFSSRRLRAELSATQAEAARLRADLEAAQQRAEEAEFHRQRAVCALAAADAANRRLHGRNKRLAERLADLEHPDAAQMTALTERLERALRGAGRHLEAYWQQRDVARQLEQQARQTTALVKGLNERLGKTERRAAEADAELRALAAYRGEPRIEGGQFRPQTASEEVRRWRDQAAQLDERLREMTEINARCRCGGAS